MRHVVITAGGTREPIDDVRAVTNASTGRFGAALAAAAVAQGFRVTVLASAELARSGLLPREAHVVVFGTTASLVSALDAVGVLDAPDVVLMAAAVSDYCPERVSGKIRSDADELVIRLVRTPKILPTLRNRFPGATLVGFKLLSAVSPDELSRVGLAQCRRDRLDWTVANDLAALQGDEHPVTLCAPDGTVRSFGGERSVVAARLIRSIAGPAAPAPWRPELAGGLLPGGEPLGVTDVAGRARWWNGAARVACDPSWTLPVFDRGTLAGGVSLEKDGRWTLYVEEALRERVASQLDRRLCPVRAPHSERSWWVGRGWAPVDDAGETLGFDPPSGRDDLRRAASVLLIDVARRAVLLGRRRVAPSIGSWACPGGRLDPGEDAKTAALRELHEETALSGAQAIPAWSLRLTVGNEERVWEITNFGLLVADVAEPQPTDEFDGRWVSWDALPIRDPVTVGTQSVLAHLREWLLHG